MRVWGIVAVSIALTGCAASRQEVVAKLGDQYIGQNVDAMVVKFGPPSNTFKMNSGDTSYQWQLTSVTDINAENGIGQAQTRFCKVTALASRAGTVTQLDTEDSNAGRGIVGALGAYGSICAQRLGIPRST